MLALEKEFGGIASVSIFLCRLWRIGISSCSYLILAFCLLEALIIDSIYILAIDLFKFSISSWFNFGKLYVSRHLLLVGLLICWCIVPCSSSWLFYVCLRYMLLCFLFHLWFYWFMFSPSFLPFDFQFLPMFGSVMCLL